MEVLNLIAKLTFDSNDYEKKVKGLGDKLKSGLGNAASFVAKAGIAAVGAASAAVVSVGKQAVEAYGKYEQLVGGVETLFGAGGKSLGEYAQSVGKTINEVRDEYDSLMAAQKEVLDNASKAYKTAGLSANEYMETVTSFSASLIQSLGNDTEAAAKYADMAIVDMSDNANKMGTDMSAIQNAYQGFAKQNYTMLDNLKLGYGGTKTEMERLVADAEKLDSSFKAQRDANGDLTLSFADIVDAIHIVQDNMGITGTTAKEASSTIEGSINSAKAAYRNWVTGLADENADIEKLTNELFNAVETAANNLLPVIERVLKSMGESLKTKLPELVSRAISYVMEHLPDLLDLGVQVVKAVIEGIVKGFNTLVQMLSPMIEVNIMQPFRDKLESIKSLGRDMLDRFKDGFMEKVAEVKGKVLEIIDGIKELFHFSWEFPKPKMPHFTVNWRDLGIISIPDVDIEWYKKAYENPYMFTKPTVMGFGDGNGGEMVYGHQNLLKDIRTAVNDVIGNEPIVVQCVLDGRIVSENVTKWQRREARAVG